MELKTPIGSMPPVLSEVRRSISHRTSFDTYRGRYTIIELEFIYALMYPQIVMNTALTHQPDSRYLIISRMLKEDTVNNIRSIIHNMLTNGNNRFNLFFVNTYNGRDQIGNIVNFTLEQGYVEYNVGTALTCNVNHSVRCFAHAESKSIVIMTNQMNTEMLFKLGAVYPIIFEYEQPQELTDAFLSLDGTKYQAILTELCKDLEERKRKAQQEAAYTTLAKTLDNTDTRGLEEELQDKTNTAQRYLNDYTSYMKAINNLRNQITALKYSPITAGAELVEYLKAYKQDNILNIAMLTSTQLQLHVTVPLLYWDEEALNYYKESHRGNAYLDLSPAIRSMLDDVLIHKTITLFMEGEYRIKFDSCRPERYVGWASTEEVTVGLLHPHIYHYNCWGDNEKEIRKALTNRQYIAAYEQCEAVISGINIADSTVFMKFCEDIRYRYENRADLLCLMVNETKERISIPEYVKRWTANQNKEREVVQDETTEPNTGNDQPVPVEPANPFD